MKPWAQMVGCGTWLAAAYQLCPQHAQLELLWNALSLLDVTGHAHGCLHTQQHLQQQAWLPHHNAFARLVRDFQHVAQQVFNGMSGHASAQLPVHRVCSTQTDKQHVAADRTARTGSTAPPHTSFKHTALQRQQCPHWSQQLRARASTCFHSTCCTPVRHGHTAAAGTEHTHKTAGPGSSRPRVGRTHRPLFSQDGTTTSSSGGSSSNRSRQAAAAAAAAADSEDEDWEQDEGLEPTDLRNPELWYPAARAMTPRSLVAHLGPTNSGKTHAALAALAAAPTGVYCGPLRLLACEVADRLSSMGVPCNLVTGQEIRRVKGARHTACTVEMADLATRVDVAVLDEVQMLGDKGRGWSWSRVLLGLPASQLHLCGDPAAADLLEQLAADCGDTLSIKRYRRLAPLVVQAEALGGLHQVEDGDCVVAFGRKTLHKLRSNILQHMLGSNPDTDGPLHNPSSSSTSEGSASDTEPDFAAGEQPGWYSNSCSSSSSSDEDQAQQQQQRQQEAAARAFQGVGMVYGALPPESRRAQAALFNARGDVWPRTSVLVASDAVGMGLNLNIRRIVFTTLHKYDGVETRPLSASEIKQIAGRAGRYASGHAEGYVSVLNSEDLPLLREALATATPHVTQACLLPRFEQLEQFALDHEESQQRRADLGRQRKRPLTFHKLLKCFASDSRLSGCYFLADMKNMMQLAKLLRHVEPHMDLADMYTCCISPASADDGPVVQALLQIAAAYAYDRHVTPDCITLPCPDQPPRSAAEMKTAEELFRVYDLYLWLHSRLGAPGVFRGRRQVLKQRQHVAELIDVALKKMGGVPTGTRWGLGNA